MTKFLIDSWPIVFGLLLLYTEFRVEQYWREYDRNHG